MTYKDLLHEVERLSPTEQVLFLEAVTELILRQHPTPLRNGRTKRPSLPALTPTEIAAAEQRFRQHIGAVSLGHPTDMNNETIDADLGREYASMHDENS